MSLTRITLPLAVAALAACTAGSARRADEPAAATGAPGLQIEVDAPGRALILANGDTAAVYFRVFEQRFATLVNWRPCAGPVGCPSVPPAGRARVAFDSISGYEPDAREVIVYWWKLRRAAGGTQPDSVRSRVVAIAPPARAR